MVRIRTVLLALVAAALLVGVSPGGAMAVDLRATKGVLHVYHPATAPTLVEGSGLGAVRTFYAPISADGRTGAGYYMTGTLTTVVVGRPDGNEVRAANLAFVFGDEANQMIIGGVSLYPPTGATIAVGARTIRPIIGGSGIYSGARGYVLTTNLGADGWTHVFHYTTRWRPEPLVRASRAAAASVIAQVRPRPAPPSSTSMASPSIRRQ